MCPRCPHVSTKLRGHVKPLRLKGFFVVTPFTGQKESSLLCLKLQVVDLSISPDEGPGYSKEERFSPQKPLVIKGGYTLA